MHRRRVLLTIILALFFVLGGLSLATTTAEAHCGKCETKAKICDKCRKAGKKSCSCKKHKACAKCRKAGKKYCSCKH